LSEGAVIDNDEATPRESVGVIVLTFNSANVIERTLRAALEVSRDIHVVDSGSSAATPTIVSALGGQVVQRPFKHYADQRNWAIDEYGGRFDWQLHLDADEVLDALAIAEIKRALAAPAGASGFISNVAPIFSDGRCASAVRPISTCDCSSRVPRVAKTASTTSTSSPSNRGFALPVCCTI
jgi:glycosyltransferase involved in cell wall biosynthesis